MQLLHSGEPVLNGIEPPLAGLKASSAQWLVPELAVRAGYLKGSEWLRHATLKALVRETVA